MTIGRKKATGKGNKGKKGGRSGKRSWLWLVIVVGILLQTMVAAFVILVLRPYEKDIPVTAEQTRGEEPPPIHYEENGLGGEVVTLDSSSKKHGPAPSSVPSRSRPSAGSELPLVAIVIDDMGYQQKLGDELLKVDLNLTFAFLPHGPISDRQAARARLLGRDVLLHFPMEAADQKWDPGPGAIRLDMSRKELRKIFSENMGEVPLAVGINNHMGSRYTQNQEAMQEFLELVRDRQLFFLDSMTSRSSVGYFLAREMGIKTARRNVFLDNVRERGKIVAQIRQLLKVAGREGWAVGIGHPYPQTLEALREAQAEILAKARVVGVSKLVH